MAQSKLAPMKEAIARFAPDGAWDLKVAGDAGATPEPTAAELEIVRTSDSEGFWTR